MLVTDQMGYELIVPDFPQRIISLVPSQTELLFDLGLADRIVGVTKFCVHPAAKVRGKIIIGGTKNFQFAEIDALQPDLIIGNKEENYRAGILQLKQKYPVWLSDITDLPQALTMMQQVGALTDTVARARQLTEQIKNSFQNLISPLNIPTAYLIWRKPYLSVGQDTFIHHMLQTCGFQNVFTQLNRYPEFSAADLQQANPRLILLSSEPYPFKEKHLSEFRAICPAAMIKLVDGELFSWYGSRLQYAASYFEKLVREVKMESNLS